MRDELFRNEDDLLIDLGAATTKTLGIPDEQLKENFVEPEARDK